jgi:hypothetical protein
VEKLCIPGKGRDEKRGDKVGETESRVGGLERGRNRLTNEGGTGVTETNIILLTATHTLTQIIHNSQQSTKHEHTLPPNHPISSLSPL